jgi:sulfite exporter TauE/SafE
MSVALAGLAMGFLGSSHCVGMCGGIAGALSSATAESRGAVLRPLVHNAGRIASYAAAGALAGGFGAAFAGLGGPGGTLALRSLAALLIVAAGLHVAGWSSALLRLEVFGGGLWRRLAPLASRARSSSSLGGALVFGALWGWLPCGLVYSALAVAAASGSASGGALVMAGFGLGTLPATLAVGVFAARGRSLLRSPRARRTAGLAVVAFGVWTFAAGATASRHLATEAPNASVAHSCH